MNEIEIEELGLNLTEEQVCALVKNARAWRTENIILREELKNLQHESKEVSP